MIEQSKSGIEQSADYIFARPMGLDIAKDVFETASTKEEFKELAIVLFKMLEKYEAFYNKYHDPFIEKLQTYRTVLPLVRLKLQMISGEIGFKMEDIAFSTNSLKDTQQKCAIAARSLLDSLETKLGGE